MKINFSFLHIYYICVLGYFSGLIYWNEDTEIHRTWKYVLLEIDESLLSLKTILCTRSSTLLGTKLNDHT